VGELPLNLAGVGPGFLLQHPTLLQVLGSKVRHSEPLILFHMGQLMRPQEGIRCVLRVTEDNHIHQSDCLSAGSQE